MVSLVDKFKKSLAIASLGALPFVYGCETASETNMASAGLRTGGALAVAHGANPMHPAAFLVGFLADTLGGEAQIQAHEQNGGVDPERAYNFNLSKQYKFKVSLCRWIDLNGDGRKSNNELFSRPDAKGLYHFAPHESFFFAVKTDCPKNFDMTIELKCNSMGNNNFLDSRAYEFRGHGSSVIEFPNVAKKVLFSGKDPVSHRGKLKLNVYIGHDPNVYIGNNSNAQCLGSVDVFCDKYKEETEKYYSVTQTQK